jgi:hypothetical protein
MLSQDTRNSATPAAGIGEAGKGKRNAIFIPPPLAVSPRRRPPLARGDCCVLIDPPLAVHTDPLSGQISMDARRAVGLT